MVADEATSAQEVLADLTPSEARHLRMLEGRIERGMTIFIEVGQALAEIRDSRLYRVSHETFEAYCRERWQMERSRAYQFIRASEVVEALGEPKELKNEGLVRHLVPVFQADPERLKPIWDAVKKTARKEHKPLTTLFVRDVVRAQMNGNGKNGNGHVAGTLTTTDRLVQQINRLADSYVAWKASKPNIGERRRVTKAITDFQEALTAAKVA